MDTLFDFDNPADAQRSLKRISQAMLRAGQPVVGSEFNLRPQRTAGVSFRTALLTLASGQMVTLRVKLTGDIFQILLNKTVLPIRDQTGLGAVAEIAKAAAANQKKFQAAQARQRVELPKGIRSTAPTMLAALTTRAAFLDDQIKEASETRDGLRRELGITLDGVQEIREINESATQYALSVASTIGKGLTLDAVGVAGAIAQLQVSLDIVETNAPLWEAKGDAEQAACSRGNAASYREAIGILEQHL
ncbi:hypothetical protein BJP27_24030 (plasmid) [Pseudomonas oryzihabitans]|nr:hypothetical protein BJP27_24030 [Pseudomonas psychrotolerans]